MPYDIRVGPADRDPVDGGGEFAGRDLLVHGRGAVALPLHGGTGALAQARCAFTSARGTAPDAPALVDAGAFTSLAALLTGERAASAVLLSTLETFLACDGSWARTAEALHLHVNTVHYRMQRVEHFTGRDLSRLSDRLDLWAALMCR